MIVFFTQAVEKISDEKLDLEGLSDMIDTNIRI